MSPAGSRVGAPRVHARLFGVYLEQLDAEVSRLHRKESVTELRKRLALWRSTWRNAYEGHFEIRREDLLRYGRLLGRLAESHSSHAVAEEVLDLLALSAARQEPWIPDPESVLITAGEFNRRSGDLSRAEQRYRQASGLLEDKLTTADDIGPIHRELGRIYYELSYLHRLRGDAEATRSTLERSRAECELANDQVGAEIAKAILAVVACEEGQVDIALRELTRSPSRFEVLADDPATRDAGRDGLARRWLINARLHLVQSHLAAGDPETAREHLQRHLEDPPAAPSVSWLATALRIEAQLRLAEGDLDGARKAIGASWSAIERQSALTSAELAGATVAIAGVVHALQGSRLPALSCLEWACELPADLQNRRAQGWAWAARAILAREAGDGGAASTAVRKGLTAVERCGAPIRAFLEILGKHFRADAEGPDLHELGRLVSRTG